MVYPTPRETLFNGNSEAQARRLIAKAAAIVWDWRESDDPLMLVYRQAFERYCTGFRLWRRARLRSDLRECRIAFEAQNNSEGLRRVARLEEHIC